MRRRRLALAVTIDDSLQFLKGFPEYLVTRGWEVHVISGPGPRLDLLSTRPHIVTHPVEMARNLSFAADFRSLRAWIRLVRDIRPDVVSVGTPKAGLLGIVAATIARIPYRVYLLRGLRLETSQGLRRWVLGRAEWLTMRLSGEVLAVSRSLMERSTELHLVKSGKIRVLGEGSSNGVDTSNFDRTRFEPDALVRLRRELDLADDVPVVGYVGRLTRDKGLFVLAESLELLWREGERFQLLIVGAVDDESGEAALHRLQQLDARVSVAGQVTDPASHYALMTLLAMPSFREGFTNAILEASSSGVPVAATAATGVVDAVIDRETGLLSPVGDSVGLARSIKFLLSNPDSAAEMGKYGRTWVLRNFQRSQVQKLYADHLDSLLGQDDSKPARET